MSPIHSCSVVCLRLACGATFSPNTFSIYTQPKGRRRGEGCGLEPRHLQNLGTQKKNLVYSGIFCVLSNALDINEANMVM